MSALVTVTGMIDRFLFSISIFLTIIFVIMKLVGTISWSWLWILSPFPFYLILTFFRATFIVRPTIEKEIGKDL